MPQDSSAVRPTNGLYLYLYFEEGGTEKEYQLEVYKASPAHPSDSSRMKSKTLEWKELLKKNKGPSILIYPLMAKSVTWWKFTF
jgi:hypothetical protein